MRTWFGPVQPQNQHAVPGPQNAGTVAPSAVFSDPPGNFIILHAFVVRSSMAPSMLLELRQTISEHRTKSCRAWSAKHFVHQTTRVPYVWVRLGLVLNKEPFRSI